MASKIGSQNAGVNKAAIALKTETEIIAVVDERYLSRSYG